MARKSGRKALGLELSFNPSDSCIQGFPVLIACDGVGLFEDQEHGSLYNVGKIRGGGMAQITASVGKCPRKGKGGSSVDGECGVGPGEVDGFFARAFLHLAIARNAGECSLKFTLEPGHLHDMRIGVMGGKIALRAMQRSVKGTCEGAGVIIDDEHDLPSSPLLVVGSKIILRLSSFIKQQGRRSGKWREKDKN